MPSEDPLLSLTVRIVSGQVGHYHVAIADLHRLIDGVYVTVANLAKTGPNTDVVQKPAVPLRSFVKPDGIVCLNVAKNGNRPNAT